LVNHSCNPNAIVGFDGQVTVVKALRDIEQDEQIFISYVDSTNPYAKRQMELAERYFFQCDCPKCRHGLNAREDLFLTSPIDFPGLIHVGNEALELLASVKGDEGSVKVQKLESAMGTLSKTSVWPITRQPYPQLRDELIVALLESQQFPDSFLQSVIRHLRVDPVLFPDSWHPIRTVHSWVLAKLAIYISQGINLTSETVDLGKYNLDLGLIAYSIVDKLYKRDDALPSVHKILEAKYKEICDEFESKGLRPTSMNKEIEAEWIKMEKLADESLRVETREVVGRYCIPDTTSLLTISH
jgi:SET and MYND domain-containing protein